MCQTRGETIEQSTQSQTGLESILPRATIQEVGEMEVTRNEVEPWRMIQTAGERWRGWRWKGEWGRRASEIESVSAQTFLRIPVTSCESLTTRSSTWIVK